MISLFPFPHISPLKIGALVGWGALAYAGYRVARVIRQERRADRIICLLYHRVVPRSVYDGFSSTERIFSVAEDSFAEQLDWLRDNGYSFISMKQLVAHLEEGAPLPPRPVWISFDDGCESVATRALPILSQRDIPATVFVTTDPAAWIFTEEQGEYFEPRMSVEQIRACEAGGIAVESHAVSHRGLNEMDEPEVLSELSSSRALLSEWIGREVEYFAVPLNFYDGRTMDLCRQAGYRAVATSDNGTNNEGSDPFRIRRFIVEGCYDLAQFERALSPGVIAQRRILTVLKKVPPKVLGEKRWMPLRQAIFDSPLGSRLGFHQLRKGLMVAGVAGVAGLVLVTVMP